MRVIFLGTPDFAVPSLLALHASSHEVVTIVTQPARGAGRGRRVTPSAVEVAGVEAGIPVLSPARLDEEVLSQMADLEPDALCVVAYGALLREPVLAMPRIAPVNVHPSLLPRHRGASPIQHTILSGDEETGVCTMRMDKGLDTGDVLLQVTTAVGAEEDAVELGDRLAVLGAELLVETLDRLAVGDLDAKPQTGDATYARKLEAEDAWVDWSSSATEVLRRVRGLKPWPVAQSVLPDGRRLKLLRAVLGSGSGGVPGEVILGSSKVIEIACGQGSIRLLEAQPQGKGAQEAGSLVNGRQIAKGDRLGTR